jgi:hypothetical protein
MEEMCLSAWDSPRVYTFRADTARAVNSLFETEAENRKLKTLPAAVPLKEIVPLWDISATLADTQAFSRLSSFFAGKKARVDLRGERSVSLRFARQACSLHRRFRQSLDS